MKLLVLKNSGTCMHTKYHSHYLYGDVFINIVNITDLRLPFPDKFEEINVESFYAPEIEDRGTYCFCSVCHSLILNAVQSLCNSV